MLAMLGSTAASPSKPNFLFVLADDLDFDYKQDRKAVMPTLKKELSQGGLEFENHVAVVPVCGPSRSSLLAGRFPHNTGYVANSAGPSVAAWAKLQDDSVGAWMTKAGYHTAFLGKYVNGMECDIPKGWNHWGGLTCTKYQGQPLGGTYNYMNASQWHADFDAAGEEMLAPATIKIWDGVHQTVFLANQTLAQAKKAVAAGKPFFIHATPLTVHGGTCYGPQPEEDYAPWDPYWEYCFGAPTDGSIGISASASSATHPSVYPAVTGTTTPTQRRSGRRACPRERCSRGARAQRARTRGASTR